MYTILVDKLENNDWKSRGFDLNSTIRKILPALILVLALPLLAACQGSGQSESKLTLVAYSTPREAYEEIVPAFSKTDAGKGVAFDTSFGSSGEQSRAVEGGLPADVIALSLEPDITRLVKAGIVDANWNQGEYKGMVHHSVLAFAVRSGNPKNIRTSDDLLKTVVEVVTPNPFTSGGARWNVMAAYGARLETGESPEQATAYLGELFKHVKVQDKSARESLQTFIGGKSDVMLAYENEVVTARQKGEKLDYVIPEQTILIENPVAVAKDSKSPEQARAFVEYLRSPEAQRIFAEKGYRPVNAQVLSEVEFEQPGTLFEISKLGGWSAVQAKFFDPKSGVTATINRERGQAVESR